MPVLNTSETKKKLQKEIKKTKDSILILSAFVTLPGLRWLDAIIPEKVNVKIAARWRLFDLISSSSSIDAYNFCKDRGWSFGLDTFMHSKVYVTDSKILLGSSNLTAKGLGLMGYENREMSYSLSEPTNADFQKISDEKSYITWLDDDLYNDIYIEYEANKNNEKNKDKIRYSKKLNSKLIFSIKNLWINDLRFETPEEIFKKYSDDLTPNHLENMKYEFKESKVFNWIKQQLEDERENKTNFGWLSNKLHNALIDEPPPYRKDVKLYVNVLFEWIDFACEDIIEIRHWNHTKSLRLK